MKNIACVHCNLNKISHKEVFPLSQNKTGVFFVFYKGNTSLILRQREYFFDLLKTTLETHDSQSGQSFRDGGSILTCSLVSPAIVLHIVRAARRPDSLLVRRGARGVANGSQHTAVHFLNPANTLEESV